MASESLFPRLVLQRGMSASQTNRQVETRSAERRFHVHRLTIKEDLIFLRLSSYVLSVTRDDFGGVEKTLAGTAHLSQVLWNA